MTQQALPALILTLATVLPGTLDAQEMQQSPLGLMASEGDSVSITCYTSGSLEGLYLKKTWPQAHKVAYFEDGEEATVDPLFSERIHFSGSQRNLTITVSHLRQEDTGAYECVPATRDSVCGSPTVLVVREMLSQENCPSGSQEAVTSSASFPAVLAAGFFLAGLVLAGLVLGVLCMLRKPQIKKLRTSREKASQFIVYEDMTCGNPKTARIPNVYQ